MKEPKNKKVKKEKQQEHKEPILREVVVFNDENVKLIQDTPSQKLN